MKITLNLKTLYGEKTESTMVVEGIQVTGMSGDSSLLTLSKLYARREILLSFIIVTFRIVEKVDRIKRQYLILLYVNICWWLLCWYVIW